MYKIFLDQSKIFECDIKIEGTSLDKSEARLFLEAENFTLSFKGEINSNGTVKIPINKLKGILKEDFTGKISLEVIAEDTVFKPWESEYHTDLSKKVVVKVDENLSEVKEIQKPKISFSLKEDKYDSSKAISEIFKILDKNNVKYKSLVNKPNTLSKLIETYCEKNNIKDIKSISQIKVDLLNKLK
jgi:hypothetical protein